MVETGAPSAPTVARLGSLLMPLTRHHWPQRLTKMNLERHFREEVRSSPEPWHPMATAPKQDRCGSTDGHVALFLRNLAGGGAERVFLNLAKGLVDLGYPVDLLLCERGGQLVSEIPSDVQVIELRPSTGRRCRLLALRADPAGLPQMLLPVLLPLRSDDTLRYVDDLTTYLRIERPRALLSALPYGNLAALTARRLARIPTRIVLTEHNVARNFEHCREWRKRFLRPLIARQYRFADRIVAVSNGVASDLSTSAGVLNDRIVTIYNPIVDQTLLTKAEEPLDHPWFAPGAPPVILGMGRLTPQKDFPTLIRAFARVRAARSVRLMILGAASSEAKTVKQRRKLETLAAGLGVADDVGFPGFVHNPMPYLVRAAVFALSSAWEGFGNVLVEALACGCPVVSTDCPSGPAEILDNGRYARLVPVGDEAALAAAIVETLDNKPPSDALRQRAAVFSVERATARYAEVLGLERAATLR